MKAMTVKEFREKANSVHSNLYDYSRTAFKSIKREKIEICCKEHGPFFQNGSSHLQGHGCPKCHNKRTSKRQNRTAAEFIKLAGIKHSGKYGYSKVVYKGSQTPVVITCPTHGDFKQRPNNHLIGQTCPDCAGVDTASFIKRAKELHLHPVYDYTETVYLGTHIKVKILCEKHGAFMQSPRHHLAGSKCPVCAKTRSSGEHAILMFVRDELGLDVISRDRTQIMPKELDIFVPSLKVAIEYNGSYWHSEDRVGRTAHRDKKRLCAEKGIMLINVYQYDWDTKPERVKALLRAKLNCNKQRLYARKCEVKPITNNTAKTFCDAVHMQGGTSRSAHAYGLFYGGLLRGVMTFGKPRFTKKADWELLRLCFTEGTTVIGGAGKLFAAFHRKFPASKIISYARSDWSAGVVYCKIGFKLSHESRPNYVWVKGKKVIPRYTTQKHKLKALLGSKFRKEESEIKNMKRCGYHRIFDAGNLVFMYSPNNANSL